MKSFDTLQKMYDKEISLADKHRKNALDIKKEMDAQRYRVFDKKIQALNLTGSEYDSFMRLLDSGKKSVNEAIRLVLSDKEEPKEKEEVEMDAV